MGRDVSWAQSRQWAALLETPEVVRQGELHQAFLGGQLGSTFWKPARPAPPAPRD